MLRPAVYPRPAMAAERRTTEPLEVDLPARRYLLTGVVRNYQHDPSLNREGFDDYGAVSLAGHGEILEGGPHGKDLALLMADVDPADPRTGSVKSDELAEW